MKSLSLIQLLFVFVVVCRMPCQAQLAQSPPMGWNSWDCYGTTVTEAEVKANADYMSEKLAQYGWQYIVVDIQWSELNPKTHGYRPNAELAMDEYGRLIPAPNRFPSSANGRGFKPLSDYVHSRGLKFGIHIMRGIPRRAVEANLPVLGAEVRAADIADMQSLCPWNSDMYGVDTSKSGGQAYYDSIIQLYCSWGVDFIKADDMFGSGPKGDHSSEIAALSQAITRSSRPIVLSLSPGTRDQDLQRASFISTHANMWRISDDFWDRWVDLKNQFARFVNWNPSVKPGHWPDGDMLPLGRIGIRAERGDPRMSLLTHDEQVTLMTLWSIARSPLMFGGNLPDNDDFTLSLITNGEVLEVNQKASASKQQFSRGNQIAWVAEFAGSAARYLAVFNIGDTAVEAIRVRWSEVGLPARCAVRDLWAKKDLGVFREGRVFQVAPHGSGFYKLTPSPDGTR
jgi:alpha-galactosidase